MWYSTQTYHALGRESYMIISWWPPIMWTNLRKYMLWKLRWSEFPCFPHDPIPSTPANSPGVTSALSHVDATWICGSGANYVPVGNSWNSPNTDKNEWVHIGDVSVLSLKNQLYIQDSYVYVFFLEIYSYPKNSPHDQKWSECSVFGHRGNRHSHPKNRKYHIRLLVMYLVIFNYILYYIPT